MSLLVSLRPPHAATPIVVQNCQFTSRSLQAKDAVALKMKKALRETQTLRTGCSKTEPNIFAPPQTLFPGARDSQLEMVTTFTDKPSLVRIDTCIISSYRGNRPTKTHTHKHTNKQTHRQDRLQYTTPQLASAQCNITHGVHCFSKTFSCRRILK